MNMHSAVQSTCMTCQMFFILPALMSTHITIGSTQTIERKQTVCAFKTSDTKTCPKQKPKKITVHFQNTKNLLAY